MIPNRKAHSFFVFKQLLGKNLQNLGLFLKVFVFNTFAAFLEGGSFAFLFLSLSIMNRNSAESLKQNTIINFFQLSEWIERFKPEKLFIIFILIAISLQILRSIGTWIAQYLTATLVAKTQSDLQLQVCKKIFSFSYVKVNQYKSGDLINHIKGPSESICHLLEHLNMIVISSLMIFGNLAIMLVLSYKLTVFTSILFLFFGGIQKFFIKKIANASHKCTTASVNLNNEVVQSIQGIKVIHIFNKQKKFLRKIYSSLKNIAVSQKKLAFWNGFLVSYNETISIIIIGIILTFGAFILTNQKELILPILLTFLGLSHRMATRVQLLFRSIGTIATHYGNIFRFNQILKEKDDYQNETVGHPLKKLASSIEFQSVELVYPKNNSSALINFSYSLEKGKTIALVGPSGAGKSTIVDLLVGLYSPTKGRIFIDGNDLSSIDTKSWRNLIGVVSQDIFLFHDTIEENIKFGLHNISHQQIETAAKEAGAHDFITKLPQGYKTILGERGYRLSGGEKQRIALARTLIKDPKILILDEATSNLDSHSEKLIQETIEKNQHKRTILIVAHRLSTIIHSDDILVIKNGKLVEQGSHETLIQENGFYSYLWKLQSSKNESILTNIMPN